ncbi:TolC family protein [Prevotella cerevisiae]|uniref:TolC family protein n=1 Tax=Segatella cerevisiae TaxID=2053716 RepID=A0ABT1BV55_9BACT|nr:TolC family protein [Segatella cerevisiae]MCO6024960.1 TolC family protein [Segatella cerevisiae]
MKKIYFIALIVVLINTAKGFAQTDSLKNYMVMAVQNSPSAQAAYRSYEAALQRIIPAGSLDDPQISADFYPKPMALVDGKNIANINVMQMFPWFGTLKASKQEKSWLAEAAYQQYRKVGLSLALDVQKSWYKMLSLHEQSYTLGDNIRLLENIKKMALFKYKTPDVMYGMGKGSGGNAKMSDQLRIQVEIEKLQEQKEDVESQLATLMRQFNILLHRNENIPVVLPDTLIETLMPVVNVEDIEQRDPQLFQLKAQGNSYLAQKEKAEKMGLPMLGVGVGWMFNEKRNVGHSTSDMGDNMNHMNGMDMPMLMLKVSLPIYRKKVKAQERAAALMKASSDESYAAQVDVLRGRYEEIIREGKEERRRIQLCDKEGTILDHTISLMSSEYANGTSSITDILQTQRTLIDFKLKRYDAVAAYDMAVAEMENIDAVNDFSTHKER